MEDAKEIQKLSGLFKGVIVLFGIILAVVAFQTYSIYQIQTSWTQVEGTVIKKSKKGWVDEELNARYYLKYQYEANRKSYEGVRFNLKDDSIRSYIHLIKDYKKGHSIDVWYNPENPEEAVINTDYLRDMFALMNVLVGFIIMASTMIAKEKRWLEQTRLYMSSLAKDYDGSGLLPGTKIVKDEGERLTLNTGMSVFWCFGIPFLSLSFATILYYINTMEEINPGYTLCDYMSVMGASWLASLAFGVLFSVAFSSKLIIDKSSRTIREESKKFFNKTVRETRFNQVQKIELCREVWTEKSTLKNWMLYLEQDMAPSFFVCYKHRDVQPSNEAYLGYIKKRMTCLILTK